MIAFLTGAVLGLVYFGGLYLSVQKMSQVKHPSILMAVSLFLRMLVLLGVFFFMAKGGYKDVLLTLLGVLLIRFLIIFKTKDSIPRSEKRGD